jgi:Rps23 Pro-64 3,4-dihydroxylase Tpa1-like proline 4-hydroxylase
MPFLQSLFGPRRAPAAPAPAPAPAAWGAGRELLDLERLQAEAQAAAAAYAAAQPFPHHVFEHLIDGDTVTAVAREFPAREDTKAWLDYNGNDAAGKPLQRQKFHISDEERLGPVTQRLLYELKSARFLQVMETLSGIQGLIPDALNHGGGIHMSCRGALLKIHADFNRHPEWQLDRRLNLLLYLNHDWQIGFGGDLELWDQQMQNCARKIAPMAGRCVVFSTSSTSYHGHPEPIDCPDHVARKSIALYYYTSPKRAADEPVHSTLWQPRPGTGD